MTDLDDAQAERMARRQGKSGGSKAEIAPASLETMIAIGTMVEIGGVEFEIAAVPIVRLAQAGRLIAQIPDVLIAHALTASANDGQASVQATAETLLQMLTLKGAPSVQSVTPESVEVMLAAVPTQITDDQIVAMIDLVILLLQRRNPGINAKRDFIAENLQLDDFTNILAIMFRLNNGLARHF